MASIAGEPHVVAESFSDDNVKTAMLPFAFPWFTGATSTIGVSSNGQINLDGSTSHNCCDPDPVDAIAYGGDRIAFAQEDLNPALGGEIYFLNKSTSFVVSFEGVPFWREEGSLNVQVELYDDGAIEIRWGDGEVPPDERFAAGIESSVAEFAFPVTSETSPVFDGTLPGISVLGEWPTGRGVRFECAFTDAPSPMPTPAPSTSVPTAAPSTSLPPTTGDRLCIELPATSSFVSIAGEPGVVETVFPDDLVETVTLPFAFPWLDGPTSTIGVSSNGQLNMDGSTDHNCCAADPVDTVAYGGDRVAFAQEDLNPSLGGAIYFLNKSTSFVISFEGVPFFLNSGSVEAQVELYDDGTIEIRWGDGEVRSSERFAAGIESSAAGLAYPVTNMTNSVFDGFEPGLSAFGQWPSDDGVRFACAPVTKAPTYETVMPTG